MKHEIPLAKALEQRAAEHLLRQAADLPADSSRDFRGNDYLDLARHPTVLERAAEYLQRFGSGATASRLVSGTLAAHTELEQRLAEHKGYPAALVFGSGYLTNLGVVTALVGRGDVVFADKLIHASLIDAVRLSGARLKRFRHNDPEHLSHLLQGTPAEGRRLIVTESVFSMDGDLAPLEPIVFAAERHNAWVLVDEAHATGIFGTAGQGCVAAAGLQHLVNITMGTLSKGLGGYGGFVACSGTMREHLVNHARSFIYTTGLPPASLGSALGALDVLRAEPDRGGRLLTRAAAFRRQLADGGLDCLHSASQIVPVVLGSNEAALAAAEGLRAVGIEAVAMRPPTVPAGTARLRLSLHLGLSEKALQDAASYLMQSGSPPLTRS